MFAEKDFIYTEDTKSGGECAEINHCKEGECDGEDVINIFEIIPFLPYFNGRKNAESISYTEKHYKKEDFKTHLFSSAIELDFHYDQKKQAPFS